MQNLRIRDPGPVRGGGRQAITAEWANRMRDCVMALARVIPQQTRKPAEWTPSAMPFQLAARNDQGVIKWKVLSELSSVTNGTNGDAYDLGEAGTDWTTTNPKKFDTEHSLASNETRYIILKADVSASLVASNWTLADVAGADAEEVGLDGGSPEAQDEIRLLIGKLTVDTGPDPDTVTVSQAVFSPQRTTIGFLNGLEVLVFEPCGINLDDL